MRRFIHTAVAIIALVPVLQTRAQQLPPNLQKYWDYRERLNDQFLVVGPDQGMSIPADHRNTLIGNIKWSDATVDQGWYLGALATEHFLLSRPGQYPEYASGPVDLETNTAELYYAIKAMQRLDVQAETSFILCPGLPNENGFFIRDDVPINFHTNFDGMSSTFSDYVALDIYDKEMSQDQMYHVLLGCSLIKRYVDPGTTYNNENLVDLTVSIASNILQHVAGYSNWLIKNPVCNKPVDRGPDAWSLAFGTNEMIKWITDGAVNYDSDIEVILNEGVWPAIGQATNPIHINSDNTHMIMTIGAVGRLWGNNTLLRLMNLSTLQDFYLYPMLHGALYGIGNVHAWPDYSDQLNSIAAAMLEEAPASGPASPQPFPGTHGWASANRFIRDRDDQVNGGGGSAGRIYHGLDYMLLHNLHYLLFECPAPEFTLPNEGLFCSYKKDFDLSPYGSPAGGVFSGPGVLADRFFNPSVSGPGEHTLYYILTDSTGCAVSDSVTVTVETCTGIAHELLSGLSFSPNPVRDEAQIQLTLEEPAMLQIRICDAAGRLAGYRQDFSLPSGTQVVPVDLSRFSAGMYFLLIQRNGALAGVIPMVVQ